MEVAPWAVTQSWEKWFWRARSGGEHASLNVSIVQACTGVKWGKKEFRLRAEEVTLLMHLTWRSCRLDWELISELYLVLSPMQGNKSLLWILSWNMAQLAIYQDHQIILNQENEKRRAWQSWDKDICLKKDDGYEAWKCQFYLLYQFLSKKGSNSLLGCLHSICSLFTYSWAHQPPLDPTSVPS